MSQQTARRQRRILMVADSKIPVPPLGYGGAERIMAHLANGLAAAGHQIRLMAHRDSRIDGRVVGYQWSGDGPRIKRGFCKIQFSAMFARELMRRPDIVIANCRIDYLYALKRWRRPLIYRFGNPIAPGQVQALHGLGLPNLRIVALTEAHGAQHKNATSLRIINNCVDLDQLTYSSTCGEGYLAFLGRLTRNKGVDTAIRIARRSGLPLRLAGTISDEEGGQEFFASEVQPHLDDQIRWIGEITDADKSAFLGNARALLMPIQWEEPFGNVVVEALACGTPVIACPRGSMPELVRPGLNGFLATTDEELTNAVARLSTIDRARCRDDAVARFSAKAMVEKYADLMDEMLSGVDSRAPRESRDAGPRFKASG